MNEPPEDVRQELNELRTRVAEWLTRLDVVATAVQVEIDAMRGAGNASNRG